MSPRCLSFVVAAALSLSLGSTALAASTTSQIRQNWETFFSPSTPTDQRVQLLQDGQEFQGKLPQGAAIPTPQASQVKISNIYVNGDTANVVFTIHAKGKPELQNVPGYAVKENGTWKVSRQTFCYLELTSPSPPLGCVGDHR